jgi:hypothetical protein
VDPRQRLGAIVHDMPEVRIDHLYRETTHWIESVAWWRRLGFEFAATWGQEPHRAGTLVNGRASVVLAEVGSEASPDQSTFLATDDLAALSDAVGVDIVDTHWGTRMVSLTDPDGRTYNIEPAGDEDRAKTDDRGER